MEPEQLRLFLTRYRVVVFSALPARLLRYMVRRHHRPDGMEIPETETFRRGCRLRGPRRQDMEREDVGPTAVFLPHRRREPAQRQVRSCPTLISCARLSRLRRKPALRFNPTWCARIATPKAEAVAVVTIQAAIRISRPPGCVPQIKPGRVVRTWARAISIGILRL